MQEVWEKEMEGAVRLEVLMQKRVEESIWPEMYTQKPVGFLLLKT